MSERKGATILLAIIAIAALGFSGYMFVKNEIIAAPGTTAPNNGLILVGLWDNLERNEEYAPYNINYSWLIEFADNQFNDSNHIEMSNNNTSFKLLKEGFYKITLLLLLSSVDPGEVYWAYLLRNGVFDHCLARVPISDNPSSSFHQVESSAYVKSTGLDNFSIRCYSAGVEFGIGTPATFVQFSIEYNQ